MRMSATSTIDHIPEPVRYFLWRRLAEFCGLLLLLLAAALFSVGIGGFVARRNVFALLMCIELMLNAVNLSFVAFSKMYTDIKGQTTVFFVLVVAAAEVVVGLGIIVAIFRRRPGATADDIAELKG